MMIIFLLLWNLFYDPNVTNLTFIDLNVCEVSDMGISTHHILEMENIPAFGVNTMPADALVPKVASTSAGMVLPV